MGVKVLEPKKKNKRAARVEMSALLWCPVCKDVHLFIGNNENFQYVTGTNCKRSKSGRITQRVVSIHSDMEA